MFPLLLLLVTCHFILFPGFIQIAQADFVISAELLESGSVSSSISFPTQSTKQIENTALISDGSTQAFVKVYMPYSDGCTLNSTYSLPPNWGLVLTSGGCTIDSKAALATAMNATLLVVITLNSSTPLDLDSLPTTRTYVDFPVIYFDNQSSEQLQQSVLAPMEEDPSVLAARITITNDQVLDSSVWEFTLMIIVALLGISFLASIFLHFYLYRSRQQRLRDAQMMMIADRLMYQPPVISEDDLDKYPLLVYGVDIHRSSPVRDETENISTTSQPSTPTLSLAKIQENDSVTIDIPPIAFSSIPLVNEEWSTCAICIEEFEVGDQLRQLPCKHHFHKACLDPWITEKNASCPLCKFSLLPKSPTSSSSSLPLEQPRNELLTNIPVRSNWERTRIAFSSFFLSNLRPLLFSRSRSSSSVLQATRSSDSEVNQMREVSNDLYGPRQIISNTSDELQIVIYPSPSVSQLKNSPSIVDDDAQICDKSSSISTKNGEKNEDGFEIEDLVLVSSPISRKGSEKRADEVSYYSVAVDGNDAKSQYEDARDSLENEP